MDKFIAQGGQFWLNDEPQMIQAGEFHYYRTPVEQWPHRLGLLKAAGFNTLATYIPWLWHQLDEDVSDFDGHSHPMRDLAGFLDLAAEMGFLIIARPGPYIMAETINEGVPPWVFRKYPQTAFISQDQKAQNIVSYLHPDFLACVKKWYRAVFEVLTPRQVTHGGKIVMIQLDNEMGMIHWVRNIFDTNPDTVTRFADYLSRVYGAALPDRYPAAQLEEFLRANILLPNESHAARLVEDYRRFFRVYLREYAEFLLEEAKANGMDVLPVVNVHGFGNGGKTFPIGLSQLISVMDMDGMVSATDVYPIWIGEANIHQLLLVNEIMKTLHNKAQPLFSIEFQAGGNQDFGSGQSSLYDLHSRLCISSGMRAINHYLFCDGENDPVLSPAKRHDWGHPVRKDGTLRGHYFRYGKLSKVLAAYGSDLILSRPRTTATVGFLLDYFMTEVNNSFSQEAASILTFQRDTVLFDMIARGLSLTHRPFDALEISRDPLDASRTPLLWVMMEKQCSADTQQKLVDYVLQGGRLILAGRMCSEDFARQPCTILQDAIGIQQVRDDAPFTPNFIHAFNHREIPISFLETYDGEFDEIFASDMNGMTAGFIKNMGLGRVMVFGAALAANTLDDLNVVHQMADRMGCPPLFEADPWADVRISCAENGNFLFVNHYQDDPLETRIKYQNEIMFGGNPVRLPARRGLILPIEWRLNANVLIHYVTSEIVEIAEDASGMMLKMDQNEFDAELTLSGYDCDHAGIIKESDGTTRIRIQGHDGVIRLKKNTD